MAPRRDPAGTRRGTSPAPTTPRSRARAPATGLSSVTARILVGARHRHAGGRPARSSSPTLERDWLDPADIPGMPEAADAGRRGRRARRERIVVFGDFDLDGISAAATATLGPASDGGATCDAVVPHRFREGYGLSDGVARAARLRSRRRSWSRSTAASRARPRSPLLERAGIDVVVTDHHEPGEGVPDGVPVANPKLAEGGLARSRAPGVALTLVQAVGALLGVPDAWRRPHRPGDARHGCRHRAAGRTRTARSWPTGSRARATRAARRRRRARGGRGRRHSTSLDADRVAFALAPRLNAAGRMADPESRSSCC